MGLICIQCEGHDYDYRCELMLFVVRSQIILVLLLHASVKLTTTSLYALQSSIYIYVYAM